MKTKLTIIVIAIIISIVCCSFIQKQNSRSSLEVSNTIDTTAILRPSKLGGIAEIPFAEKYAIVIGAFRHKAYADKRVEYSEGLGYKAQIVSFKNGLLAVVICPTNDLEEALNNLDKLRGTRVCPHDSWILTNE